MKLFTIMLLLTFSIGCKSQSNLEQVNTKKSTELKPPFKNQGEQENYWAQEFFKTKYEKQFYETFSNDIKEIAINEIEEIDEIQLFYDNKSFKIYGIDKSLKLIFKKGLLYPQLFSGFSTEPRKSDKELDSHSVSERVFYEMSRGDNLTISNLEELEFLSDSPKVKRFRFWLMFPQTVNPRVYLFELTNENADKNTELKEFLENSELTFLKVSNILI
ncbi:hypothetical protein [Aurantibacter aestuarii]|uniref:Lipoprotein n=1 Tax=Aurantibacter aestuarii TaxID=1266046 RepID=A0A2T1NEM7_9FLAO|nr:hypothetical protein [Aurantibacter aestuarii]PSG90905.1 hypothetical protein C7H52_06430 [Aurantibacter aestuarii]